jgi:hypothetical protein
VELETALAFNKTCVVSVCVYSFYTTKEMPIILIRIHSNNFASAASIVMHLVCQPSGYDAVKCT